MSNLHPIFDSICASIKRGSFMPATPERREAALDRLAEAVEQTPPATTGNAYMTEAEATEHQAEEESRWDQFNCGDRFE